MKKKTSSILLLSAFAALVLAGCNTPDAPKSSAAESLESSVTSESQQEESKGPEASSSKTESATSTPASSASSKPASSSSKPASSSQAASSSSAPASSSTPKTWTEMGIVGEYKGGMTSLVINADGTTSWDTDNTHFPATCTEVGGGVYHIVSAASVEAEDKVDVYTDGTMAYVIHDDDALDNYVMDKQARGESATAFAETEDETKWFGGIELTSGHWKYFANINGVFHFGVTVKLQAGNNINAGGAIFDVTIGGTKSTFRVTEAAANVGAFATVEAFNLTTTTYAGDHGDLVVGKTESGELAYVKLDGTDVKDATLDGDVITVKNAETTTTTKTDDGVFATYTTTTYTLAQVARTYTTGTGTVNAPLFHELTGNSGTYNVHVGADGHLWATFKSPIGGVMHITETIRVPAGGTSGDDTHLVVYRASATTLYTGSYTSSTGVVLAEDDGYNAIDATWDVEPNVTYVIKLGAYNDRNYDYTYQNSSMAGEEEEMEWEFTPNTLETYTGDLGDLKVEKKGSTVKNVTLNGQAITDYRLSGNALTLTTKLADTTDVTNITFTTTTTVITLDPNTFTYTSTVTPVTTNPFATLSESDTAFTRATDDSGNIWVTFTPSVDGIIDITETGMGTISDSYLAVYDLTALGNDISKLKSATANAMAYSDAIPAVVSNLAVQGGHTYVIKHGAYAARDVLVGETTPTATYKNSTMSFNFAFSDLTPVTYTGADGDLVTWLKAGALHHATLQGTNLPGAMIENGAVVVKGTPTYDTTTTPDDPTMTSTDTVYTLDAATHTYVKTTPTTTRSIVTVLTEASTGLSGTLGEDGSLWASFTPTVDGFISIDETIQATNGSSKDTLVAVYEKKTTGAAWSDYAGYSSDTYPTGSLKALNAVAPYQSGADNGTSAVYVHDLPVQAGHTYIIKIGAYAGNSYYIGNPLTGTTVAWVGALEAFSFSFDAIESATFTGADGDLLLTTFGGKLQGAKLAGATLQKDKLIYDDEAGTLALVGNSTYDLTTDPLDPVENRTDKVYTLDKDAGTYTVADTPVANHLFREITPGTEFHGVTGRDGNYYAKFTAEADGVIKIKDLALANSADYVVVYEAKATNTPGSYKGYSKSVDNNNSFVAYKYASSANVESDNIEVEAGKTYIIKVCSYTTKDYAPGQTAAAAYQGLAGTIELTFTPYVYINATGPRGDLVITTLNGNATKVSLDGNVIPNAKVSADGKTVTVVGTAIVDYSGDEPVIATPTTTYTIGDEGEYTVAVTTETSEIYQATATALGTYNIEAATNGLGLIKFVAPTDGQYTITALMPSADCKLGVYQDAECTTLVTGTTAKDSALSGIAEVVTFTAVAGETYYIKVAQYASFSNAVTSTATSNYGGYDIEVTIEGGSQSTANQGSSSYDPYDDDYWDDYYDDWY